MQRKPKQATFIRYANRKLYSRDLSRYINLSEVNELINSGYSVKIKQHGSDQDVTPLALGELIRRMPAKEVNLQKITQLIQEATCID
jgi:polyhydroxyalkanoate synthesis regulator protein